MDVSMLKVNQEAIIESIDGNGHLRLRLLEMGLLPNVHIKVIRKDEMKKALVMKK